MGPFTCSIALHEATEGLPLTKAVSIIFVRCLGLRTPGSNYANGPFIPYRTKENLKMGHVSPTTDIATSRWSTIQTGLVIAVTSRKVPFLVVLLQTHAMQSSPGNGRLTPVSGLMSKVFTLG